MKTWKSPKIIALLIIILIIIPIALFSLSASGRKLSRPKENSQNLSLNSNSSKPAEKSLNVLVPPLKPPLKTGRFAKDRDDIQFKLALAAFADLYRKFSSNSSYTPYIKENIEKAFFEMRESQRGIVFEWQKTAAGFVSLEQEGLKFTLKLKGWKKESRDYDFEEKNDILVITRLDGGTNKVMLVTPARVDSVDTSYTKVASSLKPSGAVAMLPPQSIASRFSGSTTKPSSVLSFEQSTALIERISEVIPELVALGECISKTSVLDKTIAISSDALRVTYRDNLGNSHGVFDVREAFTIADNAGYKLVIFLSNEGETKEEIEKFLIKAGLDNELLGKIEVVKKIDSFNKTNISTLKVLISNSEGDKDIQKEFGQNKIRYGVLSTQGIERDEVPSFLRALLHIMTLDEVSAEVAIVPNYLNLEAAELIRNK